jgi:hypothetical protein
MTINLKKRRNNGHLGVRLLKDFKLIKNFLIIKLPFQQKIQLEIDI